MSAPPAVLSVLIPVRAGAPDTYLARLKLREICDLEGVETVLVDDGSPPEVSDALKAFCVAQGWRYVFEDSRDVPFSLSRARNVGISAARTEWVFLDDADIVYPERFFQRIRQELAQLEATPFSFLSMPVVYLTQAATDRILVENHIDEAWLTTRLLLENPQGDPDNQVVQSYAPASALLALRKETLLAAGCYDAGFEGWGGEDRDLIFRLLLGNDRQPRPDNFEMTTSAPLNSIRDFDGWRAALRLHGDYLARKGFYAFHCWHETRGWKNQSAKQANLEQAAHKAMALAAQGQTGNTSPQDYAQLRASLLFSSFNTGQYRRQHVLRTRREALLAKWQKFKSNPHGFFRDARLTPLKAVAYLFREKRFITIKSKRKE